MLSSPVFFIKKVVTSYLVTQPILAWNLFIIYYNIYKLKNYKL